MKKRVLTGIMAAAMVMSACFGAQSSIIAHAQELTQVENPDDVDYGEMISEEDAEILQNMFDADFYASENKDVVDSIKETLGDNYSDEEYQNLLFAHFCAYGMYEGRSLSADFNVSAFASAYPELKDIIGLDVIAYYKYAATHDLEAEGRTITTLKEAAEAGITVSNITNPNMKITPAGFYKAEALGIKSLQVLSTKVVGTMTINTAMNSTAHNDVELEVVIADASKDSSVDNSNGGDGTEVVYTAALDAETERQLQNMKEHFVGNVTLNSSASFFIVIDGNEEIAIYDSHGIKNFADVAPISCTSNYDSATVDVETNSFREIVATESIKTVTNADGEEVNEYEIAYSNGFASDGSYLGDNYFDEPSELAAWITEEVVDSGKTLTYLNWGMSNPNWCCPLSCASLVKDDGTLCVDRDKVYGTYDEVVNSSEDSSENANSDTQQNDITQSTESAEGDSQSDDNMNAE